MRYRLSVPLMVLAQGDDQQGAIPIGAGQIVEISPTMDDRFVVVSSEGQQFLAFKADFDQQAELLTTG